jgi:hypothetical protein
MRLKIAATLFASLWVGGFLPAENRLFINDQTVNVGGTKIAVPILLNNDQTLYGFSLSLKTDPAMLKIVDPGVDHAGTVIPDAGWSFGQWTTDGSRISWGVVLDVTEPFDVNKVIPAGQNLKIANLYVDVIPTVDATTQVIFENVPANPSANPPQPGAKNLLVGNQGDTVAFVTANATITIKSGQVTFKRGDSNHNNSVDISDPIFTLNFLFLGGEAPLCKDAADADDDGLVNITDAIFELNFLFLGGSPIPPPWDAPGVDPTPDAVPCDA